MALVTVQHSHNSSAESPQCSNSDGESDEDESSNTVEKRQCFFAGKDTALVLALKDLPQHIAERRLSTDSIRSTNSTQSNNSDIQHHLQSMFYLLGHEDTLKMAVKLESQRINRTRYLVIASRCCYRPLITEKRNRIVRHNSTKITNPNACRTETTVGGMTGSPPSTTADLAVDSGVRGVGGKQKIKKHLDEQQNSKFNNNNVLEQDNLLGSGDNSKNLNKSNASQLSSLAATNAAINLHNGCFEESCLLGIDCNENTTIGLVVPILADTTIHLDGDGGFSISVYGKTHIFKPVSVQAMWSALQTLHKVSQKARESNFYPGGPSHDWLTHYESRIGSDQSCLNEWNAMDSLESRRPPSPDAIRNKPTAKEETESIIKMKLKEIMMSVDLDEVTSKYIRGRLEEHLDMDLGEYKSFIDEEMLIILGQMDAPTEIFEHVYLGSEWNASNLEELQKNGVRHILNVTREIDNFFPGMFNYLNVRVYDDEKTNLLKHWDNTYRYISRAKAEGSKVLVHCKMGVSRSASVVIAYAMKAYNWEFQKALDHVKNRRNCIKPNKNFLNQLETYRGMLDAMKNKEKLQRSKSETNLKSSKDARMLPGSEPTPLIQALNQSKLKTDTSGKDSQALILIGSTVDISHSMGAFLKHRNRTTTESKCSKQGHSMRRSSSSSPRPARSHNSPPMVMRQQSQSLENLTPERGAADEPKNMRVPGNNGENYSVTQNQVLHIQKHTPIGKDSGIPAQQSTSASSFISSVRLIVHDLESHQTKTSDRITKARSLCSDSGANEKSLRKPNWTSASKLIKQVSNISCNSSRYTNEKSGVFKRQHSRKVRSWTAPDNVISFENSENGSNSSVDSNSTHASESSAKYTEIQIDRRELPLRHASWGSGDNRYSMTLRNNSWAAYDTNRNNCLYRFNQNSTNNAIFEGQIQQQILSNKNIASMDASPHYPAAHQYNLTTVKRGKDKVEGCLMLKKICQNSNTVEDRLQILKQKNSTNLTQQTVMNDSKPVDCNQRFNSDENMSDTTTTTTYSPSGRYSDGSRPYNSAEMFAPSDTTNSYTYSDIENKNNVNIDCTIGGDAGTINDEDSVLLRSGCIIQIPDENSRRISGNVQILKQSFEAKAGGCGVGVGIGVGVGVGVGVGIGVPFSNLPGMPNTTTCRTVANKSLVAHHSLPSSPVAHHTHSQQFQDKRISAIETNFSSADMMNMSTPSSAIAKSNSSSSAKTRPAGKDQIVHNVKNLATKYQTTTSTTVATITTTATVTAVTNSNRPSSIHTATVHKTRPESCYVTPKHNEFSQSITTASSSAPSASSTPLPNPFITITSTGTGTSSSISSSTSTSTSSSTSSSNSNKLLVQPPWQQSQSQQQRRLQQHGKTHPLARLSLPKQTFNTSAYNTM